MYILFSTHMTNSFSCRPEFSFKKSLLSVVELELYCRAA